MLETEKEDLLQKLACFGCEYKEDCVEEFEHGHSQCDEKYNDAYTFARMIKLINWPLVDVRNG